MGLLNIIYELPHPLGAHFAFFWLYDFFSMKLLLRHHVTNATTCGYAYTAITKNIKFYPIFYDTVEI